jgi:UDP-GlcNAc:undecaprenyl-phosphate/decaprenyl-phosphate GlcNAc-1-phosphate transferase
MSLKWSVAVVVVAVLGASGASGAARQRAVFKDARERVSYALGVEAGQQFRNRAIALDPDAFARGLKDVLAGKTPQLTDEQVKAAIAELQASVKQREFDIRSGRAEATRKAAGAFLAENAGKEGVVVLPNGLQYKILVPGRGRKPTDTDVVECAYRGTLIDGMEFDSSSRGGSSPIVRIDQAIVGLREALKLMPVGSKWQVFVPPSLASGPVTATMVVPPNQVLIYEVELLAIK